MDLERITREVEWQVLRDTRSKGAVNRRLDPDLTAATLPGALSLELLCPQCTPERVETLCRGGAETGGGGGHGAARLCNSGTGPPWGAA